MTEQLYAVIMAGGKGERFWPLSTARRPKQLLSLIGGRPLLAMAVERLEGLIPPERILIVTNAELVDASRAAAPSLPPRNVVGEPVGRDTAAACALGLALVQARDPNGIICTLTADHVIGDDAVFHATLREGAAIARTQGALITIGIKPSFPSTGFGYIEGGARVDHEGSIEFVHAERFVEKPDLPTAERYLQSGNFCWNSGMFIWSVDGLRDALGSHRPGLLEVADRLAAAVDTADFDEKLAAEYVVLPRISVDYAIMEKARNIIMAKGAFLWDDIGSWPALRNHFESDDDGNITVGAVESLDAADNIVVSEHRLTALIGVRDLVVVQAEGATLVCHKDRAQDVKQVVRLIAEKGKHDHLL